MRLFLCGLFAALPSLCLAQAEQLLVSIPSGYTLGSSQEADDGSVLIQEWVPPGEDISAWSQLLTVQIYRNIPGGNPAMFHDRVQQQFTQVCPSGEWHDVTAGAESGTSFDLMLASCPNAQGEAARESFLSKAMAGRDALYIVQGAWRGPLSQEAVTSWSQFLATVTICDSRRAEAPCPQ